MKMLSATSLFSIKAPFWRSFPAASGLMDGEISSSAKYTRHPAGRFLTIVEIGENLEANDLDI